MCRDGQALIISPCKRRLPIANGGCLVDVFEAMGLKWILDLEVAEQCLGAKKLLIC